MKVPFAKGVPRFSVGGKSRKEILVFVSDSIPGEFNRIAEVSDNYVVLVQEQQLVSGRQYDAYYQFFNPSLQVLYVNDYELKSGIIKNIDFDYNSSGEIIDNSFNYELNTMILDDRSSNLEDRPDYPVILWSQFLLLFVFVWVLNQTSKLYKKGGVFTS